MVTNETQVVTTGRRSSEGEEKPLAEISTLDSLVTALDAELVVAGKSMARALRNRCRAAHAILADVTKIANVVITTVLINAARRLKYMDERRVEMMIANNEKISAALLNAINSTHDREASKGLTNSVNLLIL
ncbi:hypothetical protein O3P69_014206 [Scylla paramamosain]|uniref:Uncharacterized protein n=1 Tax=Scylla paramamosain TaxID=85552 RepID=A0AAW0SAX6_SCYPA